jgi:hypothetical protein
MTAKLDPKNAMTKEQVEALIRTIHMDWDFSNWVLHDGMRMRPNGVQLGDTDQWFFALEFTDGMYSQPKFCELEVLPWAFRHVFNRSLQLADLVQIKEAVFDRTAGIEAAFVDMRELFKPEHLEIFPEQVRAWMPECGHLQDDSGMQFYIDEPPRYDAQGGLSATAMAPTGQRVECLLTEHIEALNIDLSKWDWKFSKKDILARSLGDYELGESKQIRHDLYAYALKRKGVNYTFYRRLLNDSLLHLFTAHGQVTTHRLKGADQTEETVVTIEPMFASFIDELSHIEMQQSGAAKNSGLNQVAPFFLRAEGFIPAWAMNLDRLNAWMLSACTPQIAALARQYCFVQLDHVPEEGTGRLIPMLGMTYKQGLSEQAEVKNPLARWAIRSAMTSYASMEEAWTLMQAKLTQMVQLAEAFVAFCELFGDLDELWKKDAARQLLPCHRYALSDTTGMQLVLEHLVEQPVSHTPYAVDTICLVQPMEEVLTTWIEKFHARVKQGMPVPNRRFVRRIRLSRPNKGHHIFAQSPHDSSLKGTWKYVSRQKKTMALVSGSVGIDLPALHPHEGGALSNANWKLSFEFLIDGAWFRWDTTKWKDPSRLNTHHYEANMQKLVDSMNALLSSQYAQPLDDFKRDGVCKVRALVAANKSTGNSRSPGLLFYVDGPSARPLNDYHFRPLTQWAMFWELGSVSTEEGFNRAMASVCRRLPRIRKTLMRIHNLLGDIGTDARIAALKKLTNAAFETVVDRSVLGFVTGVMASPSEIHHIDYWEHPISGSAENRLERWCDLVERNRARSKPEITPAFVNSTRFSEDSVWVGEWAGKATQGKWAYEFVDAKPHVALDIEYEIGIPSLDMTFSSNVNSIAHWKMKSKLMVDSESLYGNSQGLSVRIGMGLPIYAIVDDSASCEIIESIDSEIFA